jgi:hypothetical protein
MEKKFDPIWEQSEGRIFIGAAGFLVPPGSVAASAFPPEAPSRGRFLIFWKRGCFVDPDSVAPFGFEQRHDGFVQFGRNGEIAVERLPPRSKASFIG